MARFACARSLELAATQHKFNGGTRFHQKGVFFAIKGLRAPKCGVFVGLSDFSAAVVMRPPGVEPGSQAWEACMMPLHYKRL